MSFLNAWDEYQIGFDSPSYLWLLPVLLIPLWVFSFRSLAGLGPVRRVIALLFRTVVLTICVLALADIQLKRSTEKLSVIYLLDQSKSIQPAQREALVNYVNTAIREHRDRDDRAGVVVFGRDSSIQTPPFDSDVQISDNQEVQLDPEYTNLQGAIKLAQATFPGDSAKRIVIVTDGNQNMGDALEQAQGAIESGISIDVVPVHFSHRAEVLVEKISVPSDIRKGQPFDLRVVVNNTAVATEADAGNVSGTLIVRQQTDDAPVTLSEQKISLAPGKRVFTIRQQIDEPAFYSYEAQFVPDTAADDAMVENNRGTAFTYIRGSGQVLLIEDFENPREHELLVDRMRKQNIEITVRKSDQAFSGLQELQQYDSIILANVPREHFTDEQLVMLAQNTQLMGGGLVMLGGPNSFGAGGWASTEVEKAMPLDFQIKAAKVVPKGALAMVMHASEMPDGNYWQKVVAQEALKTLGNQDFCAVIHYGATDQWLWNAPRGFWRIGGNRPQMLARLDRMQPGDMPDFDPGLAMAVQGFRQLDATEKPAIKHMIVISDGDPSPPSPRVIRNLKDLNVTITTVAVGTHGPAESRLMQNIARDTGGKYYAVNSGKALPQIYQKEARRVARPLVHENPKGFAPQVRYPHEMLAGLDEGYPPLTGYVMTSIKKNPLVEIALTAPEPVGQDNTTLLASWTYGLGKAVCWTSDDGARWSTAWVDWDGYDKFFSQMIRWSMRPVGDQGKFTVSTDNVDGKVRVVVTALDKDDEFLNFLDMNSTVLGPDMKPRDLKLVQTAPGRYVGEFAGEDAGSYFVMINPGQGTTPIRTGVNVAYSAEYRDRETNTPLLEQLAKMTPTGGKPGVLIDDPTGELNPVTMLKFNSFRHDLPHATSSQDIWHYLLWAAGLVFFGDVFIRRVTLNLDWVGPWMATARDTLLRRERAPQPTPMMERLRSRKAEVSGDLERRRAATRFEPQPDAPASTEAIEDALGQADAPTLAKPKPSGPGMGPTGGEEEDSYTNRLLKAKKQARKDLEG
jgi:uncharacterized membrane protein